MKHKHWSPLNATHLYAHEDDFTLLVTSRCVIWLMLAKASPRNPNVDIDAKSSKLDSLLVVKRWQTM